MPIIEKKTLVGDCLKKGIKSIEKVEKDKKYEEIKTELADIVGMTKQGFNKWLVCDVSTIPKRSFFILVRLIISRGNVDLAWLEMLMSGTDYVMPASITPNILAAFLRIAHKENEKPISENEMFELINKFDWSNSKSLLIEDSDTFLHKKEILQNPKEIKLQGISLNQYIPSYVRELRQALSNGTKLYTIVLNPESQVVRMAAQRIHGSWSSEDHRALILSTLKELDNIRGYGDVEIRVFDYMPPYRISVYQHSVNEKSVSHTHIYPYKNVIAGSDMASIPAIVANKREEPHFFHFFNKQFDTMWDDSTPWMG